MKPRGSVLGHSGSVCYLAAGACVFVCGLAYIKYVKLISRKPDRLLAIRFVLNIIDLGSRILLDTFRIDAVLHV